MTMPRDIWAFSASSMVRFEGMTSFLETKRRKPEGGMKWVGTKTTTLDWP